MNGQKARKILFLQEAIAVIDDATAKLEDVADQIVAANDPPYMAVSASLYMGCEAVEQAYRQIFSLLVENDDSFTEKALLDAIIGGSLKHSEEIRAKISAIGAITIRRPA